MEIPYYKYEFVIGCSASELEMAAERTSSVSGNNYQIIGKFLEELANIRNKQIHYLVAKISDSAIYYSQDNIYLQIDEAQMPKYQKIVDNYNKINIGFVEVGSARICDVRFVSRPHRLGTPVEQGIFYRPAEGKHLPILEKIPETAKGLFKICSGSDRKYFQSKRGLPTSMEIRASEEDMRNMFDFEISVDKKNYMTYMDHFIELEAGRGDKWYIRTSDYPDEITNVFLRNTTQTEDEDSSESSESD